MAFAIIGIIVGLILGFQINLPIPLELTKYSAVIIMGILDALFGAIRAEVVKEDQFDATIFITGLVFNTVLSIAITLLGDKLGLDLYLAATFVFTFRILSNVGEARRAILDKYMKTHFLKSDKSVNTKEK